jgi:hypothetical protein
MTKQFQVGERVCLIQEDAYKENFVYTIIKTNPADHSVIKLDQIFHWVLSEQARYATKKEIKVFELKKVFIKK